MKEYDWLRISELLFRKRVGLISRSEQNELDQWLSASDRYRQLYERMLRGESFEESMRFIETLDKKSASDRILIAIKRRRRRQNMIRIGSAAAVVALVALFSIIIRTNRETSPNNSLMTSDITLSISDGRQIILDPSGMGDEWMEHLTHGSETVSETESDVVAVKLTVPRGKEYRLMLPDGSSVWLNSESAIEYPSLFSGGKREVVLTGEAFFDITEDSANPFEITTHDQLKITVLGTRFNVNSYADVDETYVTLVEGAVFVSYDGEGIVLSPNQQAIFNREFNDLHSRDINDTTIYCSWTRGMFDFENEPVEVILQAIGEWYGIRFEYEGIDLNSLGHFTLTAPRGDDYSHVIGMLGKITGLKYIVEKETVYLSH